MSSPRSERLSRNLADVRRRIAAAAAEAGRRPDEIRLVAVTKYVDVAVTAALAACGQVDLGESRPQQLWLKAEAPELRDVRWHLIGHLQRNKTARTLPLAAWVHSGDSLRLLEELDAVGRVLDRPRVRTLLEVNLTGEAAKHGFAPAEVPPLCDALSSFASLDIAGLMGMSAAEDDAAAARRRFATLRELRDSLRRDWHGRFDLNELSMGMSHDFEAAILEGATLVRIGSALFEGLDAQGRA